MAKLASVIAWAHGSFAWSIDVADGLSKIKRLERLRRFVVQCKDENQVKMSGHVRLNEHVGTTAASPSF
jgi:hypothetical protein